MPLTALSLLSTKLNRPPAPRDQIDRPRLVAMLDRGLPGPITVVSAAAGFGKTTLVSSWIETLSATGRETDHAAWLSLDPPDGDLGVFLRYFVAAIRPGLRRRLRRNACVASGAGARLARLLSWSRSPTRSRCCRTASSWSWMTTTRSMGTHVHDFISELLRHWPERLHLVLIARTSPPLPLAMLRAKGRLTEIRTRDLRFTL